MGKLQQWLGTGTYPQQAPADMFARPEFANSSPQYYDTLRTQGLRYALDSKVLGSPTQDYTRLASHMTGLCYLSINLISTLVSNSELSIWERDDDNPDGATRLPHDHPVCQLYSNPNAVDTQADLLYQYIQQYELTGMGLMWCPPDKDPNRNDRVQISEMWSMPRVGMVLNPPTPDYPRGYWYAMPYGIYSGYLNNYLYAGAKIPAEQVMVFRKHHPYLRWEGYSILTAMANSVSTLEAIDEARLSVQQQGTEQSVAVEFDKEVLQPDQTTIDRIRSEWFANYSGPSNAGKIVFLGGGAKLNKLSTTPAEMAWQEGWAQVSEYLLSAFGTTKALVGMVDGMTHSTLYGSLKANHITKLLPLLNNLAARNNKDVIHPYYTSDLNMRLEGTPIHDDELTERQIELDCRIGARTIAEVRRERGLESTGQPWELERAMIGGDKSADEKKPPTGKERDEKERAELGERRAKEEAKRPQNPEGRGAAGPRGKSLEAFRFGGDRAETMLHAMERYKSNGVIGDLPPPNGKKTIPVS